MFVRQPPFIQSVSVYRLTQSMVAFLEKVIARQPRSAPCMSSFRLIVRMCRQWVNDADLQINP